MKVFTPNTVIVSSEINGNFDELKTVTDSYTAKGFVAPDSGWIAPTFVNNWVNYGGGYNTAGYRKDAMGYVHLRGLIKSGTAAQNAFVLPAGYRPEMRELLSVQSNDTEGRIDVLTTGDVLMQGISNIWVCLDGLTFKAYQ